MRTSAAAAEPLPSGGLSPRLTVTVLGSGTSTGVPMIGCPCGVCHSPNPRDKRMRPSILVTVAPSPGTNPTQPANLLVDTGPEMRIQTLRAGVERIEAALITHYHADHIMGMDDIRQFNFRQGAAIPVYGDLSTLDHLRMVFSYAFRDTPAAGGKPQLDLTEIAPRTSFTVAGVTVTPLTVFHGKQPIIAYKFGDHFAYVTDVSRIPDETLPYLRGVDTLILGAVRHEPHPTHFSIEEAIEQARALGVRQTYLTHLSHYVDHDRDDAALPTGVNLAYDGLRFTIPAAEAGAAIEPGQDA